MGISTVRAVFYILMVAISGGLFLYTIAAGGLTWIKASAAGILQFHKIFHKAYYWCCYLVVMISLMISVLYFADSYFCKNVTEASYAVGIQAFLADEENTEREIEDEEAYLTKKRQQYLNQAVHHEQNGFFYLFMSMLWFVMIIMNTGFITEKGYYPMYSLKAKELSAREQDGKLQFWLAENADKPFLILENTPENRSHFAPLLEKNKENERKLICCIKK